MAHSDDLGLQYECGPKLGASDTLEYARRVQSGPGFGGWRHGVMLRRNQRTFWTIALSLVVVGSALSSAGRALAGPKCDQFFSAGPDDGKTKKVTTKKKSKPKKSDDEMPHVRWGQKRNETDAEYDKRYARLLKQIKQDKRGDFSDGTFMKGQEEVRLWTYMGHPFIVRTDISKEFTADTAMYMEMLHREYGRAYAKLLGGVPADVREKIEVIVFADQTTYMQNGGTPGSGGFFMSFGHLVGDRGPHWPARRYRLQQFTDGVTDFRKWEKGTLKHEAAHMELQLRLGNTLYPGANIGIPVDCPRWWNEGHAAVFEYWDFDKTVEENFAEIPNRGRYAPVIRRIVGTPKWKDFNYVWTIDPESWHKDMTSEQGFLNYAQAWSLAAYMMGGGRQGWKDFRAVFDLSKRVGSDRQTTYMGDRMRAWEEKFPAEAKEALEKHWTKWVEENISRDKSVPDEEYYLKLGGYNPDVKDKLQRFSSAEIESLRKWIKEEEERRKKSKEIER